MRSCTRFPWTKILAAGLISVGLLVSGGWFLAGMGDLAQAAPSAQDLPTMTPTPTPGLQVPEAGGSEASPKEPPAQEPPATPTPALPLATIDESQILTGTIFANRSDVPVTFFLEGKLYELPPFRSTSTTLGRPLSVLNLFNCPAGQAEDETCFWDPYPVREDGFYEIVNGAEEGKPVALLLQEASPPPANQVWIQNRTGHPEQLLYQGALFEAENTGVLEITLAEEDLEPRFHLRHCLALGDEEVCEWLPQPVVGGVYYSLREESSLGETRGALDRRMLLEPVITQAGVELIIATPEPEIPKAACQVQVPALNVRAGPGTQYLVIDKIRQDDEHEGNILVVGQSEDGTWLAVDPELVEGGWVINQERFLICQDEVADLPVAEVTDGRLAPTPTPTPVVEAPPQEAEPAPEEPSGPVVAPGRALLIVTNAFERPIRFTLSPEEHDLPPGTPAEHDLQPGESIQLDVGAGRIRFSASTPWHGGLSGNAEFVMDEGEVRELFIHFAPSVDDPNVWVLRY